MAGWKCTAHFSVLFSTTSFRRQTRAHTKSGDGGVLICRRAVCSSSARIDHQNCAVWISQTIVSRSFCMYLEDELSKSRADQGSWRKSLDRPHISSKPTPKLRNAPQPPLSHPGAPADSDRAKKPPLVEPSGTGQELSLGDRVEGLGDFGIPTGEFGTVRQVNEDDAVVKWDGDGCTRIHQPSLKKVHAVPTVLHRQRR